MRKIIKKILAPIVRELIKEEFERISRSIDEIQHTSDNKES